MQQKKKHRKIHHPAMLRPGAYRIGANAFFSRSHHPSMLCIRRHLRHRLVWNAAVLWRLVRAAHTHHAYVISDGEHEGKRQPGISICEWVYNIHVFCWLCSENRRKRSVYCWLRGFHVSGAHGEWVFDVTMAFLIHMLWDESYMYSGYFHTLLKIKNITAI